jgi:hypothetical protein
LAIGLAVYRTRVELGRLRGSVASMRALARELQVEDASRISAINRLATRPSEMILDVYVPPPSADNPNLQLCLVLEGILGHGRNANFPEPLEAFLLKPGRRKIEIRHVRPASSDPEGEHVIEILVDDEPAMRATRPKEWMPTGGWTSTGSIAESVSFAPDKPAELHRRRYNEKTNGGSRSKPGDEPANGILLWIDRPTN